MDVVQTYFETWNARDFDAFEANLAPSMTFEGPMGTASNASEARQGIEGMSRMMERVEIIVMAADGDDVITWFHMHVPDKAPVPVANWARVAGEKVAQVRVTFDPRPLLG